MLNIREVLNGVKKYVDEVVNEAVSGSKCNGGGGSINYKKLERTNEEIKKDESLEIDLKEILNEELDDENNTIFINPIIIKTDGKYAITIKHNDEKLYEVTYIEGDYYDNQPIVAVEFNKDDSLVLSIDNSDDEDITINELKIFLSKV